MPIVSEELVDTVMALEEPLRILGDKLERPELEEILKAALDDVYAE